MNAEHRYVNANGIRQHYIDYAGEGPALILMPGLTANARFFDGLISAGLAPALRVIAVDLRGRGETDQPDTGYSMAEHAADILALMDELGIEQVNLGGHSFGGLLTYYLAAHFPERFSRCVVIDAPAEVHQGIVEQILGMEVDEDARVGIDGAGSLRDLGAYGAPDVPKSFEALGRVKQCPGVG